MLTGRFTKKSKQTSVTKHSGSNKHRNKSWTDTVSYVTRNSFDLFRLMLNTTPPYLIYPY